MRQVFHWLNRFFMVPMFRAGFGRFIVNPWTGYILVLITTGRKSGKTRFTPVNYAVSNGMVYCLAGWGKVADWYKNLMAHPNLRILLPKGEVEGTASEVVEPEERARMARRVMQNSGFAAYSMGVDPYRIKEDDFRKAIQDTVLIRIQVANPPAWLKDPRG